MCLQLNLASNQLCGLYYDYFGDLQGTYTADGIMTLSEALKVTGSVTKILVSQNSLGDKGATILCDALRESKVTKVQELDLSYNDIHADGAKAVAAMAGVIGSGEFHNLEAKIMELKNDKGPLTLDLSINPL